MSRKSHVKLAGLYKRISTNGLCAYCGLYATTLDHFVPVSVAAYVIVNPKDKVLIPSCSECNGLAGSKLFKSVGAKRRYIRQRLRKRYARLLKMPDWADEELEKLGWTLRKSIEVALRQRDQVRQRLSSVPTAIVNSSKTESGSASVHKAAAINSMLKRPSVPEKPGEINIDELEL